MFEGIGGVRHLVGARAELRRPAKESLDNPLLRNRVGAEQAFGHPTTKHGAEGVKRHVRSCLPVRALVSAIHPLRVEIIVAVAGDNLGELGSELVCSKGVDVDGKGIGLAVAVLGNDAGACRALICLFSPSAGV